MQLARGFIGPITGPSTVLPPNLRILDDDVAGVFDEILGQEEKETFYQIKSLAALEKIIDSLRRALGCHLKVDAVADLRKDSLPSRAQVHRAISQVLGQVSPQTYITQDQEPIEDWFVLARRARHAIF
ncbi:hypothetical protein VULLAG_LOCUS5 [Vulpes lagopus]